MILFQPNCWEIYSSCWIPLSSVPAYSFFLPVQINWSREIGFLEVQSSKNSWIFDVTCEFLHDEGQHYCHDMNNAGLHQRINMNNVTNTTWRAHYLLHLNFLVLVTVSNNMQAWQWPAVPEIEAVVYKAFRTSTGNIVCVQNVQTIFLTLSMFTKM